MVKPVVNVAELALNSDSHGEKFAVQTGEIGEALGLYRLGAMLHVVPPGKAAFPYHRHHVSDELFFIVSGSGVYRIGDDQLPVKAGDCLGAPAGGEAHQIINTGTGVLRYIGFSNNDNAEVVEYPDSGKIGIRAARTGSHHDKPTFRARGRLAAASYWEGE